MDTATAHLRALAGRIVDAALERVPLRAAMITGSAGRGDADFHSDLELPLEFPPGTRKQPWAR